MRFIEKEARWCSKCHRNNWHDNPHCSWCHRRLYTSKEKGVHRVMDVIILTVAITALAALVWRAL